MEEGERRGIRGLGKRRNAAEGVDMVEGGKVDFAGKKDLVALTNSMLFY